MLPLRIKGTTRRLAENQDDYFALSIKDIVLGGRQYMLSSWEPSPAETLELRTGNSSILVQYRSADGTIIDAGVFDISGAEGSLLELGASLQLAIPGEKHPPVCLSVIPRAEAEQIRENRTHKDLCDVRVRTAVVEALHG